MTGELPWQGAGTRSASDRSWRSKDGYYAQRPAQRAFLDAAYALRDAIRDYGIPVPVDVIHLCNTMDSKTGALIGAEETKIRKRRGTGEKTV